MNGEKLTTNDQRQTCETTKEAMTIDERLEALTRNLQVMAIESEKRDKQIAQLATVVFEVTEGTARLLARARSSQQR
jgi:hypothetical protein